MPHHRNTKCKKKAVIGLVVGGSVAVGAAAVLASSAQAARVNTHGDDARAVGGRGEGFSPFLDASDSRAPELASTAAENGVRSFTLGYLKRSTGCAAEGGDEVLAQLGRLRQGGGDVRVSFGGDGGDLTPSCSSAKALAAAYAKVIDKYKITKVDFDVQGFVLNMPDLNPRRSQAIALLQKNHPGLDVSISLPALANGLTPNGLKVLSSAKEKGARVSTVNIVTADPGDSAAGDDLLKDTTSAATTTQRQLKSTLGLSETQAWKSLAITPRIGANDFGKRTFTLENAKTLVAFANSKHVGRLSMDSMNRDKQCQGSSGGANASCSGVRQEPFAFSKILGSYRG
ncbi:chitinase [Streptomyces sp. NPDC020801]|uniref:chitinase n=1 Tax=unclassified Streptomyces TaxID=2593676 RepID=UPI0037B2FA3F